MLWIYLRSPSEISSERTDKFVFGLNLSVCQYVLQTYFPDFYPKSSGKDPTNPTNPTNLKLEVYLSGLSGATLNIFFIELTNVLRYEACQLSVGTKPSLFGKCRNKLKPGSPASPCVWCFLLQPGQREGLVPHSFEQKERQRPYRLYNQLL